MQQQKLTPPRDVLQAVLLPNASDSSEQSCVATAYNAQDCGVTFTVLYQACQMPWKSGGFSEGQQGLPHM